MNTPQRCPKCGKSLEDPSVPRRFLRYRKQFTLALQQGDDWVCPFCYRTWPVGESALP